MTINFDFVVDYIDKQTNTIKQRQQTITFCGDADTMHIGTLAELEVYVFNLPLWAKVAIGMVPIKKVNPLDITKDFYMTNWGEDKFIEYGHILLDMLSFFCTDTQSEKGILAMRDKNISNIQDLSTLADLLVHLYNLLYTREYTQRQYFEHNGKKFVIPHGTDGELIGRNLTWGEATEAMQSDFMTNRPDANGKRNSAAYLQNSLTIIASICREVHVAPDNTFKEIQPPKKSEAWEKYIHERRDFFADLPASIAMDVGFFLLSSLASKNNIISLALLLNSQKFKEELMAVP